MPPPSPPRCPWRARSGPDRFPIAAARDSGVIHELFLSSGLPTPPPPLSHHGPRNPSTVHSVHGWNHQDPSSSTTSALPLPTVDKTPLGPRRPKRSMGSCVRGTGGRQAGGTAHRGAVFYPPFYGRLLFVAWTTTTTAKQSKAKEKVRGWCMFPPLFSCAMTAPMDGEEQTRAEPPSARCVCAPAHTQDLEIVCVCDGAAVKGHGERRGEARPRCEGGPDQAEVRVC